MSYNKENWTDCVDSELLSEDDPNKWKMVMSMWRRNNNNNITVNELNNTGRKVLISYDKVINYEQNSEL